MRRSRQGDGKGGTFGRAAAEVDLAAHEVQISFDDAEAQTGSGYAGGIGGAEEAFEQVLLLFGGYAYAPVPDGDVDGVGPIRQGTIDGGGFRRVFNGVGQEVVEDITQELDIDKDEPGWAFYVQLDMLPFFQGIFHVLNGLTGKMDQIGLRRTIPDDAAFELFEGEEVVEDLPEVVDIGLDAVDMFDAFVLLVGIGVFFDQGDG